MPDLLKIKANGARLLESDLIDTFKNAKNGMDVPVNGFCRIISILISG